MCVISLFIGYFMESSIAIACSIVAWVNHQLTQQKYEDEYGNHRQSCGQKGISKWHLARGKWEKLAVQLRNVAIPDA
jgi:hypothetical protein